RALLHVLLDVPLADAGQRLQRVPTGLLRGAGGIDGGFSRSGVDRRAAPPQGRIRDRARRVLQRPRLQPGGSADGRQRSLRAGSPVPLGGPGDAALSSARRRAQRRELTAAPPALLFAAYLRSSGRRENRRARRELTSSLRSWRT